jgi:hypothetical protein
MTFWRKVGAGVALGIAAIYGLFAFALPNFAYGTMTIFLKQHFGISEPDLEQAAANSWIPLLVGFAIGAGIFGSLWWKSRTDDIKTGQEKNVDRWERLTDYDREHLRRFFNYFVDGHIAIHYSPTTDCEQLASDFRTFFLEQNWKVQHIVCRPNLEPGIVIATVKDVERPQGHPLPQTLGKNMREATGANRLLQGLAHIGLRGVAHKVRGATIAEERGDVSKFTIHMNIGLKPKPIVWQ